MIISIKNTVIILCTLCMCIIRNVMCTDPLASKYGRLIFSTLLYRHGNRSIEKTYPNDPYANKSYWPMGFGQLTPAGIENQLELGKWLRKRYSEWLPEVYSAEDVYVRSTDFDRTIMSAQANLAGMYPPVGSKAWDGLPGKYIQLVPIHTVPSSQDNILTMSDEDCPLFVQEYENLIKYDIGIRQFYAQFDWVFEYIKNKTDIKMTENWIKSTIELYDSLLVESQFNYTLPEWTKSIFPEPLLTIVKEDFELPTHTNTLKRIKSGPLLNEIVTHMHEKKNGTMNPNRMLWVYSAHDTTIVNLLNTMGLYERILVPYSAVLLIELRLNSTGNYVVTISYRNTSNYEPYLLHVPGCDSVACELDKFTDVLKPMFTVNWYNECKANVKNNFLELLIYLGAIVIIAIVVMVISYLISDNVIFCFRRQTDYQTF